MDYNNFLNIRKNIIEKEFSRMNDMQKKAVFRIKGPLLILAGAGSGKTTVLVNRISNLLKYGDAYNSEKSSRTPDEYDVELMQRYLAGDSSVYHEIRDVFPPAHGKFWRLHLPIKPQMSLKNASLKC